jgi:chromosome segregation ATPase
MKCKLTRYEDKKNEFEQELTQYECKKNEFEQELTQYEYKKNEWGQGQTHLERRKTWERKWENCIISNIKQKVQGR